MQVFSTIVPIFAVVILGWLARRRGFMPPEFLGPANQLVYYLAIPALIFRAISKASFHTQFNMQVLLITLSSTVLAYLGAWLIGHATRWPKGRIGAFIQCSAHGNHGYIGLPIAYYFMGESGLAKAGILAGFLMILQNVLSVLVLQACAVEDAGKRIRPRIIIEKLIRNPVIVSALAGIAFSAMPLTLPAPAARLMDILSGLAPPMSLLLIGASLSMEVIRKNVYSVMGSVVVKIIALPLVGLALFLSFGLKIEDFLPGLILLATPTATVSYVMAKEMHADDEFAGAAISASTLASSLTYLIWLMAVRS